MKSFRILIHWIKIKVGKVFINQSVKLFKDWACYISFYLDSCSSWIKKNFRDIYFVWSPWMYPSLTWVIYSILFLYIIVGSSIIRGTSHELLICRVKLGSNPLELFVLKETEFMTSMMPSYFEQIRHNFSRNHYGLWILFNFL